jgi:multidrug efflux pump subunit AcrB
VIAWFARHPTAANLLMAAIMVLGLVALPDLQRATFPEIENDEVQIRAVYPGATPDEVEDAVCRRIEDVLEAVTDLDELRCEAREGLGTATAVMREGAEMTRFLDDVKSQIDTIDDFPDDVETPVIEELGRTEPVVSIAVTGPDDARALKAYAEDLKARLLTLEDVAEVTVKGFSDRQIRIEIPAWRLRQYGLSAADIADAVGRQSVGGPAGRLEGVSEDVLLRIDDQRKSVEAMRDLIVISGASGAGIRLGEIAEISDRFELAEEKVIFDGHRAAVLDIAKTSAQDTLRVFETVQAFVAAERARVPAGIELTLTQDSASIVQDRLQLLVTNGLQGLVLVCGVLWLFFGFRYSFWVTMGLPVSFLGALFVMPLLGITLNMISMVGLLIAIGLLMDDAIVISENVAARMGKGDPPLHAAIEGTREVLPGILSSFATTVLVFGSLAFITGDLGQILRIMPIVLILVLTVSLIEAFWILPHHLAHSLAHAQQSTTSAFRAGFERRFDALRDRHFGPLLDRAVEQRYLTIGIVMMLVLLAIAMPVGGVLKFVGFPELDGDVVEARILMPQGTPLARTEAVVAEVERGVARISEVFDPRQPPGQPLVRQITVIHGENPDAYETGPHVARVVVDLLGAEQRDAPLDDILALWREAVGAVPDVIAIKYTEPAIGPAGRAIDLRLLGPELDRLKAASLEAQEWLNGYAGVLDLSDDLRPGKREYRLRLKTEAGVLGFDARTVANQLRGAFQGITIDEFPVGTETYEVDLRLVAEDRAEAADLEDFVIVGPDGGLVPLSVVAELEEVRGWARIHRVDGQRAVTIQGDVDRDATNAQELLNLLSTELSPVLSERYPGVRLDLQGESRESAQTGQSIARNVLLALIGVYLLLAFQLRGYLAPITVMLIVPAALIGVVFGHLILGLDLTMPSIIGMASLLGVVVNNSILLVFFIRSERARGASAVEAAKLAGRARFRSILLTSLTTFVGLAPLLFEQSLQAQVLIPMAASLAFGLTTATLAALFLVPALYAVLDDLGFSEGDRDESNPRSPLAQPSAPAP